MLPIHRTFLLTSLLVVIGCGQRPADAPKANSANPTPPALTTVQPQKKSVRRVVEQPGTIQADEETQLFAKVSGYVAKVLVDIGQEVKGPQFDKDGKPLQSGTLLAEVAVPELVEEAREKSALVRKAEAEVEQARKALVAAEAGVKSAEALATEAKAGLTRAQAQYDRWESEYSRVAGLVKGGVIDAQTRDETHNQFRASQATRDEALARITSTKAAVARAEADRDKADADVSAALAKVEVAKADAARLQAMLGYTKITAPYDGIVTRRHINTGDLLNANSAKEGIFSVARIDPVRAVVEVPEVDAGFVRNGLPAKVAIGSADGPERSGTVSRTSWALEPGSRTLRVEIDLPNQDRALSPGTYILARMTAELPAAWALPASAVVRLGDGYVGYRVVDGKALRTPVQVLRGDGQFTQVSKWQKPGTNEWTDFTGDEKVVVQGANVSDGQAVP
jgi:RND family efflux transporter MFP subunit